MSVPDKRVTPAQARELLGEGFSQDLASRVEERLGVDVIVLPLEKPGYSLQLGNRHVIVVGATDRWFRSNFTIAHELGHILFPSALNGGSRRDEDAANAFAAELLMPETMIRSMSWTDTNPHLIAEHVWKMGVSTQALRTRLDYLRPPVSDAVRSILETPTPRLIRESLSTSVASSEDVTERMARSARRRFPQRLLTDLRKAVEVGRAPHASLAWALGVPGEEEADESSEELSPDLLDGLV